MHLLKNHPNFDGLAEADLVSKQRLAGHLEERAVGGVCLMFEEFDAFFVEM